MRTKSIATAGQQGKHQERLHRLEREGLIRRGTGRLPPEFWERPRPADPDGLVLKALLEEREQGR